jgi:hypothetical protein
MVTGVFNSTGLSAYIDGVLVASNTNPYSPSNVSSTELFIGAIYSGAEYLTADIASVAIYGTALSETQILQNYYAGLQKLIPQGETLVLWLDGENTNTRVITPTTAYDMSVNDFNGSLVNGVTLSHRDGRTTFLFDGIDDRIVTSLNQLNPSTTWTVWVKRTESINAYNMIMGMYLPYFAFRSDGSIHFSNNIGGSQQSLFAYPGLVDDVWYHITFVSSYDGNTTMKIYLDGVLQNSAIYPGRQLDTTTDSFRLGTWYSGGSEQFKGKIGEVKIYFTVFSDEEILRMYTATKSRYGY